jgi:Flp pilus assembly pilin Flp
MWISLLRDEEGQDLLEYALLASIVALAGVLLLPAMRAAMSAVFSDGRTAIDALWIPNDPL